MFPRLDSRLTHYTLLTVAWAALCLPNLGQPSLWDVDEGRNSGAALEMFASGDWIKPTFNNVLRVDKPALIYWLQVAGYSSLGIGELAARLPSALACLLSMLCTYELGRSLFGRSAGLLAGLLIGSTVGVCAAAHFANPDSLLHAFTCLALTLFWLDYSRNGRWWFVNCGFACGFALLAKGPVGVLLPGAVAFAFLVWQRDLRKLLDWRILWGIVALIAVAGPWYIWVTVETKGEWLRGFWNLHHRLRLVSALESHSGPFWYYLPVLFLGLAPWSLYLYPTLRHWWRRDPARDDRTRAGLRFLTCWIGVYLVVFSIAQTKLPNYVLPLYPAMAVLVAGFLDAWRRGAVTMPRWMLWGGVAGLVLIGAGVMVGILLASGTIPGLRPRNTFPGLERYAVLGLLPLVGAAAAAWAVRRQRRGAFVGALALTALAFVGSLAAWGGTAIEPYKSPRALAAILPDDQLQREVRIGTFCYFQPSLVFYCRRQVTQLFLEEEALSLLEGPHTAYLFVPAAVWGKLKTRVGNSVQLQVLGKHRDLYDRCDIVVIEARHD
jgi:4-amino-4-deoxy-L-arabinose transferase-like glycosyltransferase